MERKLGLHFTDCDQLLSYLNYHQQQLKLKRRWLLELPLSKTEENKLFKYRSLPESLLRDDDIFYDTLKTYVEETFGARDSEREEHSTEETDLLFDRTNMRQNLIPNLDALTNKGLHRIATLLTGGSVNLEKTRHKMKKVIKQTIPEVFGVRTKGHLKIELRRKLSQLLNDPHNIREHCLVDFTPIFQSHRAAATKILEGLESLPTEALSTMHRKLKGDQTSIPKLNWKKERNSRRFLIGQVRKISTKMLSELQGGDELPAPLAKALAIGGLSLKITQGCTNSSVPDFDQFSPEIKSLQDKLAKAIWLLSTSLNVRMQELKTLRHLLDTEADVSSRGLRTALKKMFTEYLFVCSDLGTIPKSLLDALIIINGKSQSWRTYPQEEIQKEVECILNVSALTKQIVWDFLPDHEFDENYSEAYMEELEESDDGGGGSDDYDDDNYVDHDDGANVGDFDNDRGNFYTESYCIETDQLEESMGERMPVDSEVLMTLEQCSHPSLLLQTRNLNGFFEAAGTSTGKFEPSSHTGNSFSTIPSPNESLNDSPIEENEPEQNAKRHQGNPQDFMFEESSLPNTQSTCNNLYLGIQDVCDDMSKVAYRLIGYIMEGLAQEGGLDLDWSDISYLRGDYSSQENQEQISSEKNMSGSVIVEVVENLVPSLPKRGIEKLKQLMEV